MRAYLNVRVGNILFFYVPVEKKNVSIPDMRQSKTLDKQSMNAGHYLF